MLRLSAGGQAPKHRPRPVTVCLGQDVTCLRPISEAPIGTRRVRVVRRRESYSHEPLRDECRFPTEPSGIYLMGPHVIHSLQLLQINVNQTTEVSDWQLFSLCTS